MAADATQLDDLTDSDALFAAVFSQALVGVAVVDLRGCFRQVNAAYCRITGYDATELLGAELVSIAHPDDRDTHRSDTKRLLDSAARSGVVHERYLSRDGRVVWVQSSVSVARDALGAP